MDLGKGLRTALAKIARLPLVDEKAVKSFIRELQRVLIANDVEIKLVFSLSKKIEEKALHTEKKEYLTLKEHVLEVVYNELVNLMGKSYSPRLEKHKILVVGLYGSGKTTTSAKLAKFFIKKGLTVGLVGADLDRPAAREQLKQLAQKAGAKFYSNGETVEEIINNALSKYKEDILIVDSAGRSAFDEELAKEIKTIYSLLKPEEVYLVVNADIGQIAGKQAKQFSSIIPISGIIVTKIEGSGKGGGALSSVAATNAKIAFLGTGEKIDDLEVYDSKRFVGKLLGMPDIKGLIEKLESIQNKPKEIPKKLTIKTFYEQLKAAKQMGPLDNVFGMLGMPDVPKEITQQSQDRLKKFEAIINSMTEEEREDDLLIRKSNSRIERIAKGSGTQPQDVKRFLNEFDKMKKMMKMFERNRGFRGKIEKLLKGKKLF